MRFANTPKWRDKLEDAGFIMTTIVFPRKGQEKNCHPPYVRYAYDPKRVAEARRERQEFEMEVAKLRANRDDSKEGVGERQ